MPARLPLALSIAALAAVPGTASAASANAHRLPVAWEQRFHVRSASADPDNDGLTNWSEYRAHTNPHRADSDRDGTTDDLEDGDRDGVDNANEQLEGTDPGKRDTDGDGRPDGREDADGDGLSNLAEQQTAHDPTNPDSDGDGVDDGDDLAGRVVSFDGDTLVVRLAATGKTITGTVDDNTDVECNATDDYVADWSDGSSDDGSGDTSDDTSDSPDASAASVDSSDSSDSGDSSDDSDLSDYSGDIGDDPCFDEVLDKGAWVHAAEVEDDGAGGLTFDSVSLIDDSDA